MVIILILLTVVEFGRLICDISCRIDMIQNSKKSQESLEVATNAAKEQIEINKKNTAAIDSYRQVTDNAVKALSQTKADFVKMSHDQNLRLEKVEKKIKEISLKEDDHK